MKKKIGVLLILIGVTSFSASFELGLFSPKQLETVQTDVEGVRLGLVYTKNADVKGLDINLVANSKNNFKGLSLGSFHDVTRGNFTGVRIPWFFMGTNKVSGNMSGLQFGAFNRVQGEMVGVQFGIVNINADTRGVQTGIFNKTASHKGLQIGLVNYTKRLEGLQIGIVNIAKNSQLFEVVPLVNFKFNF